MLQQRNMCTKQQLFQYSGVHSAPSCSGTKQRLLPLPAAAPALQASPSHRLSKPAHLPASPQMQLTERAVEDGLLVMAQRADKHERQVAHVACKTQDGVELEIDHVRFVQTQAVCVCAPPPNARH